MGRDDISDWTAIHGEQQRTEYNPWGTPTSSWLQKSDAALASRTVSGPANKTESRKAQCQTLQTLCASAVSVSSDTDRVEGCGEVEADKQCDFLVVSRSADAVNDIEQRRLGRMSLPVGGLPLAEVCGVGEVGTQTCQHGSLEHLGDCR